MNPTEATVRLDGRTTLPGAGATALSAQAVSLALSAARGQHRLDEGVEAFKKVGARYGILA